MSQVSYGTITITDTNDIERIYMEYAQSTSNSVAPTSGWSENIPAWQQGYYIWQRTVTKMQGVSLTNDSYGDPVCLTGSTGSQGPQGTQGPQGNTGVGVSSITTTYCNYGTGTPAATYSGWQTTVPAYDSSKPNYWVKTVVNYNDGTSATPVIYKDNGITSATSTAAAANTTANQANTTANQANQTANEANTTAGNALSVANSANDAISDLNQYFWRQKTAATNVPAGSYVTNVPGTTYKNSPADGGFNSLVQSTGIFLRNGITTLSSWTGSALTFYQPGTSNKGIELTSTGLNFYGSSSNTNPMMELTASSLAFKTSAGATIGTFGSDSSGGLLDLSGRLNIKGGGRIGQDSTNYWEFGDNAGYNVSQAAYLLGRGNASIQLGENGHWRIDKNRIHTGWYVIGDSSSSTPAGSLHFDTYNADRTSTSSGDQYYWDYGLHFPTSNATPSNNKFLYIRYSNTTVANTTLAQMKNRIDNDNYWNYQFYVDDLGNVHAPGFYIGNSTTPIGGGAGTVAERLTQGYGSATQPVYFNSNGVPTNTTYQLNAAGAKGVDTSISASSTSTNLPTSQAVAAFVEGKGYITSYVDEKVKVTNANTTKLWVTGTATSGTSTGTLSYDSNVYLTTTSGTLHATTFDGTSFTGTAAKATADADGNAIKTTYLKLSGGQITGPVSFGDSVTMDEATVGDLVVNGNASFTNNINANTINGVAVGSSPKFTDNNTTYTFASGTNGFTVTPSGGTAQTVTVTPSITNNVTGSGTSGYLAKWNGTNTITNGPQLGSATNTFLRNDGTWATPAGTYSLSVATYNTLGGVKPAYNTTGAASLTTAAATNTTTPTIAAKTTTSGRYYAVEIDKNGILFVNVPWTNVNSSYLTGITSSDVTTALGYTPYNSTNPNGYITANHTSTYSLPIATYNTLGGVKPAYSSTGAATLTTAAATNTTTPTIAAKTTTSGRYYAVEIDKNGVLFVNVPWTNVNSSYLTSSSTLNWNNVTQNKPTTASGYGITDAITNVSATSASGGSTTFTLTKSNGTTSSFDVVVYASAATQATDANYLTDGTSRYTVGSAKKPIYFDAGIPKASDGTEGTSTKPVYLSNGTLTAGSTYAGGTAVTLNNASKAGSTASFYAPTTGGTTSQVLIGNGTTSAPVWTSISSLVPSSATNATNDSDGNPINTTYIKKSIGTAAGDIIYWSASGTPVRLAKGSDGQVLKLASGVPTWGTDNNDNTNYYHTTGSWSGLTYTATANGGAGALAFTLPTASASTSGVINTDTQVIAGKKTIKYTTRIYPIVGVSNEKSQWYKITFPYYNATTTSSAAKWFMNSFDLHFGGGYSSNASGVAHVTFYWTRAASNGAWSAPQVAAKLDGILMNKISLYYAIAEPGILYVNNSSNNYNGIWLDNLYVDDTAPSLDWSTTTIETCSAITIANYTEVPTVRTYNNNSTTYIIGNHTLPMSNNTYNLGSSDNKWANIYATTFNGNATSATSAGKWTTARNFTIKDSDSTNSGTAVSVDGSAAVTLLLPSTIKASLTGNASTATKWASAQTVYVTLGTASTSTTIQGGSSSAQTIGVNGTLGVSNGGTGITSNPSMLTNLGSTTAASVFQTSPRPGVTGTLGAANGGTGQTSLINAANSLLNALSTSSSTPVDADYYISQYVGGGTTTTTYHRRPMSALWSYISGKISASGTYVTIAGDNETITGTKSFNNILGTKYVATKGGSGCEINYNSTLEAIVFSFA